MESTERHDRQRAGQQPHDADRSFVSARRPIAPPAGNLWETLAGALRAERSAFAWLHGDTHRLALDHAPPDAGQLRYLAWRFDDARAGAPWQRWPSHVDCAPAAVATWTAGGVSAFAQGPFSGWPRAAAGAGQRAGPGVGEESKAAWMARVDAAEAACRAGTVHKVVLARATRYAGAFCATATLKALRARHPEAAVFCLARAGEAFVGATPETLVEVNQRRLSTHALAGTRRRGASAAADARLADALLHNVKERREHAAVVEDLADTLAPLCAALDWPSAPRVKALPTVQHLETPFRGRLRPGVDPVQVAETLHPTAALSGLPRPAARDWLRAHEALDRGFYGAPIGWIEGSRADNCRAHISVAIRSALLTADAAYTFAGAGIVAGSDPAAEWAETQAKQASVAESLRRAVSA